MSQIELLKFTEDAESTADDFTVNYTPVTAASDALVLAKASQRRCWPDNSCCPAWCYRANCVIAGVVLTVVASIIALSMFIDFGVTVLHPHVHVVNFVSGTCVVVSSNYTRSPGRCGCQQGGSACHQLTYPCLQVIARYTTKVGDTHQTMLHASDEEFTYTAPCSITPHCVSGSNNMAEVDAFRLKYGQLGQKLSCFHDPTGDGAVVTRKRTPLKMVHFLLWPGLASVLSFGSCLFVFCHCVPKFCKRDF